MRILFRLEVDALRQRLEMAGGLIFPIDDDWHLARTVTAIDAPARRGWSITCRSP